MRNVSMALALGAQMAALSGLGWDQGYQVEKSDLPKREPMPLTEEESTTLASLSGKAKKAFIKELKLKYQGE